MVINAIILKLNLFEGRASIDKIADHEATL